MASHNILITGAAGYIGGSLIHEFLTGNTASFKKQNISAVVRSDEQAKALSSLGVNVLQLDLTNEGAVTEAISRHNIDIVIHCSSAIDSKFALTLITALGKRKDITGAQTYFIHTSALSGFAETTGWPTGTTEDAGNVFETEKQLADSFPVRKTDVDVIEHAKAVGVTSFTVVPSTVHGKGTGEWNRLSVVLPVYVKAAITQKKVYRFIENTEKTGVHISDLAALYAQIVARVCKKEVIPNGESGYYFALAHKFHWWEFSNHLVEALKTRGLIEDSQMPPWPTHEAAAEALGVPIKFLQPLWNSIDDLAAINPYVIGWNPKWGKTRFLENIDDEVAAVLEHDKAKSSLIDSLHQAAKD